MTNRQAAIKVIDRLRDSGFESLMAGGCVRDMLLGREPKDYDVATNAEPRDVIRLFERTIKVGVQFGVVIVLLDDQQVEVATFRNECDYYDGRHPGSIEFVEAEEDAKRRDFTVNGMFYDPAKKEVTDYVDGQVDLKKQLIRTIGLPKQRFGEDYLRMLRAVRFSTQLRFKIEPETWAGVCENSQKIVKVSGERISMELEGILTDPHRSLGATMLIKSGLAGAIFPGFGGAEAKFAIKVVAELRKKVNFALAMAGFFVGCSSKFALEKCVLLMLSRNQNKHIKFLLSNRDKLLDANLSLAQLKKIAGEPYFWDLYEFQRAIQRACGESVKVLVKIKKQVKAFDDTDLHPKPLLSGHDLIKLGAVAGPGLGLLAEEMYIAQLEGSLTTVEQAKELAAEWVKRHKKVPGK